MQKPIQLVVVAALAWAFAMPALPQVTQVPVPVTVQRLAPQLVAFAGSASNFQSLVNGLALGLPVTLVTATPDGFTQTVTFTPAVALAATDIARTLELARQTLISRGIATPTAQQLGVTLAGGALPTALGAVPVAGLIPVGVAASTAASASVGSSATALPATTGGLAIQLNPTPGVLPATGTVVTTAPVPRFTSDSPFLRNTSDTLLPANPAIASPLGTSASPAFNTSNSPVFTPSAGAPSPAIQLQLRR